MLSLKLKVLIRYANTTATPALPKCRYSNTLSGMCEMCHIDLLHVYLYELTQSFITSQIRPIGAYNKKKGLIT